MKKIAVWLLLVQVFFVAKAQQKTIDSLKRDLLQSKPDTNRVLLLNALVRAYYLFKPDTAILLGQEAYSLAQQLDYPRGQALSLNRIADSYSTVGDYAKSLNLVLTALRISEKINDQAGIVRCNNNIGDTYMVQGDYKKALPYFLAAKTQAANVPNNYLRSVIILNIGECYFHLRQLDSASHYLLQNYRFVKEKEFKDMYGVHERNLGEIQAAQGNDAAALNYFLRSRESCLVSDNIQDLARVYLSISRLFQKEQRQDSALTYAQNALTTAQRGTYIQGILSASQMLSSLYENKKDIQEAFKYFKIAEAAKDSLFSQDKVKQVLSISFEETQRRQDIKAAQVSLKNQVRFYVLIAGLGIVLLLAAILWRNSRQRQKANILLQQQKSALQHSLADLKSTQTQLIQSEKMASLGELTAGIAHEIQNPLNFVNNFSEVNTELISELKEEIDKGNIDEIKTIANDIEENEQKINHHGKRADAIVKGILQHSRASSGKKEPTDINALADEYLRLSYHGLRAKDKSFNADFKTNFDESIGKIEVTPQDIGRVLLNLFNNAFYAVNEKKKQPPNSLKGEKYEPTVWVTTKSISFPLSAGGLEISVKDNGIGIPQKAVDKIFQPFFTTKPTGQGTGLGLSLSYDIIKAHGGELKVETKEGEGAEFVIELPFV